MNPFKRKGDSIELHAPLLRWAATVMGNRRHIFNVSYLQTAAIQGTHRGFAARSRTHDADFDVLHAMLLRRRARPLGGHLRRERRRFARTAKAAAARSRPGQRIALAVGNRNDGVVEGGMHMRDRIQYVLAYLLARRLVGLRAALPGILLLFSHVN